MSARRWIVELAKWIRDTGKTPEEVALASNHDPNHVKSIFNDAESNPTLTLYLDLARGCEAAFPFAPEMTGDAVISALARSFELTGLTKAAFAERLGRDRSVISRLLTGKHKNPKLDLVDDVVVGLGLSDEVRLVARAGTRTRHARAAGGAGRSSAGPRFRVVNGNDEATRDRARGDSNFQHGGARPHDWREQVNEGKERARRAEEQQETERERARQAEQQRDAERERARQAEQKRDAERERIEQLQNQHDAERRARAEAEAALKQREYEHMQQLGQKRYGPGALLGMFGLGVAATGTIAYFAYRTPKK